MQSLVKQSSNKICYMILPEGIKGELYDGLKGLSEKHGISIAVIEDVNWNDDLTVASSWRIQEGETLWREGGSISRKTDQ